MTGTGREHVQPGAPYPPQQHPSLYQFNWAAGRTLPEFGLIFIAEGRGSFESRETGQVPITAGQLLVLFPGVWHRYRPEPVTGWTEQWVHFNGTFAHNLLEQKLITPSRAVLSPADPLPVSRSLDRLLEAVHRDPATNSLHLTLLTLSGLALALDQPKEPVSEPTLRLDNEPDRDVLIEAALAYIWTRSHKVLSAADVAAAVGTTRRTLERRMTAAGRSILGEIIQCRFTRAERLVRETELPLKTVVELAGFGSQENLRQAFISHLGEPPGAYRKRHHPSPR